MEISPTIKELFQEHDELMEIIVSIFGGRLYSMSEEHGNRWFQQWPGNAYLNKLESEGKPYMTIDLVGTVRMKTPTGDTVRINTFIDLAPWPFYAKGIPTLTSDDSSDLALTLTYDLP